MQNRCAEIKIRAERKAGEMLAETEKNPGGQPEHKSYLSHDVTGRSPKLSELGVSRKESSRWQSIASIPEEQFERHVEQTKQAKQELTSAGALRLARTLKQQTTHKELQKQESPTCALSDLGRLVSEGRRFGTIYA